MKKRDRRIRRTRELLEAALLSLLKEKAFDAISVQEIIDRANVGRAKFYAHYNNKEELLESGFNGLLAALQQRQREARMLHSDTDERLFAFSGHLLAHADGHRAAFSALVSKTRWCADTACITQFAGEGGSRGRQGAALLFPARDVVRSSAP